MKIIKLLFTISSEKDERVFGLDLLRAIAILLVLFGHSRGLIKHFLNGSEILSIGGFLGVELFFVLSGFLIGTILLKVFTKSTSFGFTEIRKFWIRRWFRTLPNYYLALAINILFFLYIKKRLFLDASYFFFVQNFWSASATSFFGESWSLAVEEWFYLLFPLFLLTISFLLAKSTKKNILLVTIISFIILIGAWRTYNVFNHATEWDEDVRKVTIFRLDSIIFGCLFAYIAWYYKDWWKKNAKVLAFGGLMLVSFSWWYYFNRLQSLEPGHMLFSRTGYFTLLNLGFACFLPIASQIEKTPANFLGRFVVHTSLISYSLYLYHFSLILGGLMILHKPDHSWVSILVYCSFWLICYTSATLVYKYFEKPMTGLRETFAGKKAAVSFKN